MLSKGTSNYLERITLYDLTHMMSMTDPVAISVETLRIESGCSLEKEFIKFIRMNPCMVILPNCQLCWFMSCLCMWSFDMRHQRHVVDRWLYIDYDLRILNHEISKISYIRYDMKCLKTIVWWWWDHPPLVFEEIYWMNEMQWNSWPS